jgi:hypothetical protein
MVETRSKSRPGKGSAYGVTQRRRGAAWLQAVNAYISAKISELGFSGARHRSGRGPERECRDTLDWNPQPKRSRPQQTADSSEF